MKFLFVHQNFPGQYLHLARHLGASGKHEVVYITQRRDASALPGVKKIVYKPQRLITPGMHHYLRDAEAGILNAQEVARVALSLKNSGFVPDVMVGHNGWGEIWYLKEVFPDTPLIGYFEFFYSLYGADVGFDPADMPGFDAGPRIRTKNTGNLLGLDVADIGQCPTQWQRSRYPERYHSKLNVVHEGINTDLIVPDPTAWLHIADSSQNISAGNEIVTYVARNLEPYRGFRSFMRSLPSILSRRPNARVIIVGGDEVSYGAALPDGKTYRQQMMQEVGNELDLTRVHFVGKVPHTTFTKILQVSRVHVYLTYPFVLSWSMLEAMSAGCLVVGSATAPVQEVIRHGENGLLVDFFSSEEIADRVVEVLESAGDYEQMRKNARQTVIENYDLKTICLPRQLKLLQKAIDRTSLMA